MGGAVSAASNIVSGAGSSPLNVFGDVSSAFGSGTPNANGFSSFFKGIGGGLSAASPFHPVQTTPAPTLQAPGQVNGVTAPTLAPVAAPSAQTLSGVGQGSTNDFRQAQLNQINGLQNVANGHDNTAQRMLQQQTQQNVANQFAMANSSRPGQQASAMRQAMNNAAQMNANANVQGAQLGLQQRMQAAGLIGNIAGQGAGQDINVAGENARLGTQASIAGGQQATQRAISQGQLQGQANGQNIQAQNMNAQNTLGYGKLQNNQWNDVNTLQSGIGERAKQSQQKMIEGIAGSIPGINNIFGGSSGGTSSDGGAAGTLGGMPTGVGNDGGSGMDLGYAHGGLVVVPRHLLLARMAGRY